MTATTNATGAVALRPDEALGLLGHTGVGRVAVTTGALPAILVVHYAICGDGIVFMPASPHPPDALRGTVVAFEVSGRFSGPGDRWWSVGVTGVAQPVPTREQEETRNAFPLPGGEALFHLTPAMVAGFRFV